MARDERSTTGREQTLLRERAAELARAGRVAPERSLRPALTFSRSGRRYALDARACTGVAALGDGAVLALPDVPPPLVGYTLFRGEPLALFDLAALFGPRGGTPAQDEGEAASAAAPGGRYALVLGGERPRLGLCADEVTELAALDEALFSPAAASDPLLLGTSERLQVLDADRLLRDDRFLIDQGE